MTHYYYDSGSGPGLMYYFSGDALDSGETYDLDDDADGTFWGGSDGDFLGCSLGGGDLNLDGKDDVLVGACAKDYSGVERTGCIYLYEGPGLEGSASIEWATDMRICGVDEHRRLGRDAVSQVVDLDDDGNMDLIVGGPGSPWEDSGENGQVYVFYGASELDGTVLTDSADVIITGDSPALFGHALQLGDYNGDGDLDLAIGAPDAWSYDESPDDPGEVYLFSASTLNDAATLTQDDADLHIPSAGENLFGATLGAGDFNEDGTDELLVAMPQWNDEMGRVVLFSL